MLRMAVSEESKRADFDMRKGAIEESDGGDVTLDK